MDVSEFFGKNAEKYAKSLSHAKGEDLSILVSNLPLKKEMSAVDIAAGTGFTSIALADHVSVIAVFDKTLEMLEEAKKLFEGNGKNNAVFVKGDVDALPFLNESFDIVTCRRAAHHFHNKIQFLSEANRVMRKNGYLGLVDMVSPENDDMDLFNNLERFRDHSHASAGTARFWKGAVEGMGMKIIFAEVYPETVSFEKWLYPVTKDSEDGESCMRYLEQNSKKFRDIIDYDGNSFTKSRMVLVAQKVES
ncbi:MAG: class I SAM-dependent methyltransferase [Thermoplasmataceae archaeon]